jgi:serine/threonine protein kinase
LRRNGAFDAEYLCEHAQPRLERSNRTSWRAQRLKVLDFGISKANMPSGMPNIALMRTATLLGSPVYIPEQLNSSSSRDVDLRSDV